MPRKSKKSELLDAVYCDAAMKLLEQDTSDESCVDEVFENLEMDILQISSCRYGSISRVPRQHQWVNEVLPHLDEGRFKTITRVTYQQFGMLLELIQDSHEFRQTTGRQYPVSVQLAIAMYRFGVYGMGARFADVASLFGTGDGSTISRFTRRVIKAILKLENRYVYWPDERERQQLVDEFFDVLPNCIGWIDGTTANLAHAPICDHESYFDKDKRYSLKIQLICDHKKRIRNYVAGYPGSVHDSRIWNESAVKLKKDTYFSGDQYLSGDLGYALFNEVMIPFKDNSIEFDDATRKMYNKYFSSIRVRIEHVNGILKETFGSLKELRIIIKDRKSHKEATDWIVACIILYNIILPNDSDSTAVEFADSIEDNAGTEFSFEDDDSAKVKRAALCNFITSKT